LNPRPKLTASNKGIGMKFLVMTLLLSMTAFAHRPHLDLEMTSAEYEALLQSEALLKNKKVDPSISYAIGLGQRLSQWIAKVNSGRTETTAIRLTSPNTRRGIPIDKPNVYSPKIIAKDTADILAALPKEMKDVILSNGELPGTIGIDDETFILHARKLDRNYQSAARYKSVDQWRNEYIKMASNDVRGLYYLTKNKIGPLELQDISVFSTEKQNEIKNALKGICLNAIGNAKKCEQQLAQNLKKKNLSAYYERYIGAAQKTWNDFFVIPNYGRREDIRWIGNVAYVPFNTPTIPKFIPYLQVNIEDEFRWADWALKLNFGIHPYGPLLKFESGVVPHVNALGGNEIVMDSTQPIEEYESQWTIRHEFGHVLGLPDCYHEFYDVNLKAYVNYQLDTADLMCSRAGNMNERIYLELKRAYGK
jgi:hypothetical protein